jgi:hypothetical protein
VCVSLPKCVSDPERGGAEAQDEALTRPRLRTRAGLRPCLDGGLTRASSPTWNPLTHKDVDNLSRININDVDGCSPFIPLGLEMT